jgi:3D (Asp-Asp-Asp) domain-containing protein
MAELAGRVLGNFRNTYYNFPDAREFDGSTVSLHDGRCQVIAEVPRTFFETLCVQGSGMLSNGAPVSFHNRDCPCAEICPRTEQKICFDLLNSAQFPWGRGATGLPISPLSTVAVDSNVIPLGTALYIPEYDGLPRDKDATARHDGCFIAQDRGLKVQGLHVDIFTGRRETTEYFNNLVPSNSGVTVVIDSPRCAHSRVVR